MENVNYLRTQYGGRYEQEIVQAFEQMGYVVSVTTLNSGDFGVPQIRKRVFSSEPAWRPLSLGLSQLMVLAKRLTNTSGKLYTIFSLRIRKYPITLCCDMEKLSFRDTA